MNNYITDESTGISYTLQGDYYLPDFVLPPEEGHKTIGIWGQRHMRYLKEHRRITYTNLLISGRLNTYLAEIDEQAEGMFSRLVEQLAEKEYVTEDLKAEDSMKWAARMNNIRSRAIEIVNGDLIYT